MRTYNPIPPPWGSAAGESMVVVVLVPQWCLTLCDPMVCSSPGSSVQGILQARILQLVAFPSPGDLPDPGSPTLQADPLPSEPPVKDTA